MFSRRGLESSSMYPSMALTTATACLAPGDIGAKRTSSLSRTRPIRFSVSEILTVVLGLVASFLRVAGFPVAEMSTLTRGFMDVIASASLSSRLGMTRSMFVFAFAMDFLMNSFMLS